MFGSDKRKLEKLRSKGASATALVTAVTEGKQGNDGTTYALTLQVQPIGGLPFQAYVNQTLPPLAAPAVGRTLNVVYDPKNTDTVLVDPDPQPLGMMPAAAAPISSQSAPPAPAPAQTAGVAGLSGSDGSSGIAGLETPPPEPAPAAAPPPPVPAPAAKGGGSGVIGEVTAAFGMLRQLSEELSEVQREATSSGANPFTTNLGAFSPGLGGTATPAPGGAAAPPPVPGAPDPRMARLDALRSRGVVTEAEYQVLKMRLEAD